MPEKRVALVIATDRYEDAELAQLRAPAQDGEALAAVLRNADIGGFAVETLFNLPAHKLNQALEAFFADRGREDLLLLYFSCHGVKDEDGRLYFAAADTRRKLLRSTAVSAGYVNELMTRSRSRRQVLLLDCCYSGAFARGMLPKGDDAVGSGERFEGRGRVVLTASDAMQYSFEGDEVKGQGRRSVFTRFLVQGLSTGEADRDADGRVSLDELYDYVYDRVVQEAPGQQPGKWAFEVQGDIFVAKSPRQPAPGTAPAAPAPSGRVPEKPPAVPVKVLPPPAPPPPATASWLGGVGLSGLVIAALVGYYARDWLNHRQQAKAPDPLQRLPPSIGLGRPIGTLTPPAPPLGPLLGPALTSPQKEPGKKLLADLVIFGVPAQKDPPRPLLRWQATDCPTRRALLDVWGGGEGDVFAVGNAHTVVHWDSHKWSLQRAPGQGGLSHLWGSGNQVWAAGPGGVLRWDGARWSVFKDPGQDLALWGIGVDDLWGVGDAGRILRWQGGGPWLPVRSPTSQALLHVWGTGAQDILASGAGGTLVHFDGRSWSAQKSGTEADLYRVWGSARDDVWVAGTGGTLLHYDGGAWSVVPSGVPVHLYGLWGSARNDVWAAGDQGTLLHYDGSAWARVESPTASRLRSVWGSRWDFVWAVGEHGTILVYTH